MFDKRVEESNVLSNQIHFMDPLCLLTLPPPHHHPKSPALSPSLLSTQGYHQESEPELPAEPTSSAGVLPTLEMEEELHYASISFHKMKENTCTEYSEVNTK